MASEHAMSLMKGNAKDRIRAAAEKIGGRFGIALEPVRFDQNPEMRMIRFQTSVAEFLERLDRAVSSVVTSQPLPAPEPDGWIPNRSEKNKGGRPRKVVAGEAAGGSTGPLPAAPPAGLPESAGV